MTNHGYDWQHSGFLSGNYNFDGSVSNREEPIARS
jgi:hypothetical protein